jgi:hypothetical protein
MQVMSTETAHIELNEPQAYQAKMLRLLGDQDPLKVMARTPDELARIVDGRPAEVMRRRPYADRWTWTPNEVLGHLVDGEFVYGYRIRLILCEDRPTILGMDQEAWVRGQKYNGRETSEILESFAALRAVNLALWARMEPADLERVGRHNERGEESLGLMRRMCAGHDLSHIEQITKYLAAIERAP